MRPLSTITLIGALLTCSVVRAGTQVEITGHLHTVGAVLSGGFTTGEAYRLTYEWTGPGPVGGFNDYVIAGANLQITVGNYSIAGTQVAYYPRHEPGIYSQMTVSTSWFFYQTSEATPLSFTSALGDLFPFYVGVELSDSTGQALASRELTGPLVDLAAFDSQVFQIAFAQRVDNYGAYGVQRVFGTVESMTLVPEPASAMFLLLGLAALGWRALAPRRGPNQ